MIIKITVENNLNMKTIKKPDVPSYFCGRTIKLKKLYKAIFIDNQNLFLPERLRENQGIVPHYGLNFW